MTIALWLLVGVTAVLCVFAGREAWAIQRADREPDAPDE